jgi:hypothetical protein
MNELLDDYTLPEVSLVIIVKSGKMRQVMSHQEMVNLGSTVSFAGFFATLSVEAGAAGHEGK